MKVQCGYCERWIDADSFCGLEKVSMICALSHLKESNTVNTIEEQREYMIDQLAYALEKIIFVGTLPAVFTLSRGPLSPDETLKLLQQAVVAVDPPQPKQWDVMLDLETWGTLPGCMIRSIGAVCFDPFTRELGPEFYHNVSEIDQDMLTVDSDTVHFWQSQPRETEAALLTDQVPLVHAAATFYQWFKTVNGVNVWGHGANFDPPIWEVAAKSVGIKVPWHYRAVRDTRTMYALAGFDDKTVPTSGMEHHALWDARRQALCVQAAIRMGWECAE